MTGIRIAFTSVFNLAIPTIFLVSNAVTGYLAFSKVINEQEEKIVGLASLLVKELTTLISSLIGKDEVPFEEMAVERGVVRIAAGEPGL